MRKALTMKSIFSIEDAASLMRRGHVPSGQKRYRSSKIFTPKLYLVRAEVAEMQFQKIGLFSGSYIKDRDRKAYKEVLREVPVDKEKAVVTEEIAIGLCRGRHFCDEDLIWQLPRGWAGRTEIVATSEDLTGTFDDALLICENYSRKELVDELHSLATLQYQVVSASPGEEFKKVPSVVKEIRSRLGLSSWISRVQWRDEKLWNNSVYVEAVYWYATGRKMRKTQPRHGLYRIHRACEKDLLDALVELEKAGIDLSKFEVGEQNAP